jgi:methionine synthase I (cobalamin-dependent)
VILDGAMGTALLEAGLPPRGLPEAWLLARPDEVARVHASHAACGAELLLTCTFNLAGPRLAEAGLGERVAELARRAVEVARRAAPRARLAGAVGPVHAPGLAPAELRERHAAAFRALAAAGVDLLWAESHYDPGEALAALASARATGLPAVVTFTFGGERGRLTAAGGEPAAACLRAAAKAGAAAVGVNCALPGAPVAALLRELPDLSVPLVAKPAAGLPGALVSPEAFAAWAVELHRAGARWLGGCCGAGPAHLAALSRALSSAHARG